MENIKMSVKAARVNFTNLTQLEVAKFLDISHTAYCRKENGLQSTLPMREATTP